MTDKTYRARSGKILTDADIDALADDVGAADHATDALKARRRGRPQLGSAPAEVVPVRIDPELRLHESTPAIRQPLTTLCRLRTYALDHVRLMSRFGSR